MTTTTTAPDRTFQMSGRWDGNVRSTSGRLAGMASFPLPPRVVAGVGVSPLRSIPDRERSAPCLHGALDGGHGSLLVGISSPLSGQEIFTSACWPALRPGDRPSLTTSSPRWPSSRATSPSWLDTTTPPSFGWARDCHDLDTANPPHPMTLVWRPRTRGEGFNWFPIERGACLGGECLASYELESTH